MKQYNIKLGFKLFLLLITASACVTSGKSQDADTQEDALVVYPEVSVKIPSVELGYAIRHIGREVGGGIVLVKGLESQIVGPYEAEKGEYEDLIEVFCAVGDLAHTQKDGYYFLYPEGYESLLSYDFEAALQSTDIIPASIAFGFGTRLYNALAVLSQNLNHTFIADNLLGDVLLGELFVNECDVSTLLEALLSSARIDPATVRLEVTENYLLMKSINNRSEARPLLNEKELDDDALNQLAENVSVTLPFPHQDNVGAVFTENAVPLSRVLESLSAQLKLPVEADDALLAFPVNHCEIQGVKVREALDLVVKQWPIGGVGYEFRDGKIRIRAIEDPVTQ